MIRKLRECVVGGGAVVVAMAVGLGGGTAFSLADPSTKPATNAAPPVPPSQPAAGDAAVKEPVKADATATQGWSGQCTVTLLEPGAEPRAALRFQVKPGDSDGMRVTQSRATIIADGGQEAVRVSAPVITGWVATISETDKERFIIGFELSGAVVGDDLGDKLAGQEARYLVDNRNLLKGINVFQMLDDWGLMQADFKVQPGKNTKPGSESDAVSLGESLTLLIPRLAKEPVGVGAKWKSVERFKSAGAVMNQTTTFTLKSLAGTKATLEYTIEQSGEKQKMEVPGVPDGVTIELLSHKAAGGGTIDLDLGHAVPASQGSKIKGETKFTVKGSGSDRDVSQKFELHESLERIKPEDALPKQEKPGKSDKPAEPATAPDAGKR